MKSHQDGLGNPFWVYTLYWYIAGHFPGFPLRDKSPGENKKDFDFEVPLFRAGRSETCPARVGLESVSSVRMNLGQTSL